MPAGRGAYAGARPRGVPGRLTDVDRRGRDGGSKLDDCRRTQRERRAARTFEITERAIKRAAWALGGLALLCVIALSIAAIRLSSAPVFAALMTPADRQLGRLADPDGRAPRHDCDH